MKSGVEKYWNSSKEWALSEGTNSKVLILTNDIFQVFLYRSILEDLGYMVDVVENIEKARLNCSTILYEFFIIDFDASRVAGLELIKYLHSLKPRMNVPVYIHLHRELSKDEKDVIRTYSPLEFISENRLLLCELFYRDPQANKMRL